MSRKAPVSVVVVSIATMLLVPGESVALTETEAMAEAAAVSILNDEALSRVEAYTNIGKCVPRPLAVQTAGEFVGLKLRLEGLRGKLHTAAGPSFDRMIARFVVDLMDNAKFAMEKACK